jgi:hypothetical protein
MPAWTGPDLSGIYSPELCEQLQQTKAEADRLEAGHAKFLVDTEIDNDNAEFGYLDSLDPEAFDEADLDTATFPEDSGAIDDPKVYHNKIVEVWSAWSELTCL